MKNVKLKRYTETLIVLVILFVCLAFHFPSLTNAPWEKYDDWRQADTYSIAENYYSDSMNPLNPQFNYDGAEKNTVQLELQIVPYISAVIFKLIGNTTPFVPRFLGLLFFLGSAWYLYKTVSKATSFIPAVASLIVYLITPITLLYSRAIMPEATALFFLSGAIWYLFSWYEDDNKKSVWLSAIFTSLAIMEKTPTIFVGILVLFAFFRKLGVKAFRKKEFYGFGFISLAIPALHYFYSGAVATATYVSSIASKHILTEKIFSIFTSEAQEFFVTNMPKYFGIALLASALLGFLLSFNKKHSFFAVLTLSFLLELATIVAIIKFGYYLIFISIPFAILFGILVEFFIKNQKLIAILASLVVIVFTALSAFPLYNSLVVVDDKIDAIGKFVDENIPEDDAIAFAMGNPVYINASSRNGYRANLDYYDYIPTDTKEEIEYFIENGVGYYIALNHYVYNDSDGSYIAYIKENFPVHAKNELCTIYKLQEIE